ncbi:MULTISPECIES: 3-deoxy-7-phosphoheptulonate synthase [unclassified Mesorhizobium]|uniref:3-deoxy-7-phosphoheptulonate synthase n=1 Tax=unclassified Mesorhizobium TaxID=325217 RepID=UPI000FD5F376|nr:MULTISPECIES: 3-deoxy-7-phosphoheptulonate synthase [unclassified Mesorhizobium]RUV30347.1 3-deoxy-7-phosphoheptulonate synthase [Mesorhizobium sp. M5C.F.Ca.IN.020.32.2.1]RWH46536.1 MAG: 3-deoxy-7-phosphoheptulonate synthase [Mesorhizobium sp.]RWH51059.1 MAG: 3-deoxy-7-phosphoheptulonate synthase [Mesorhizobium sp.]RWI65322.1 MAG: 3-deoxy-7-phosphoheptulonate synthase [Mesorhizobium sp.]RWI79085.1 MAG: 3-deoxy-7-phosphoheptulonate synthase [Mesorhizobium sp.]
MLTTTDDLRVKEIRELSTPDQVMREIPRTLTATRTVTASRNAIHAVLAGADDRLIVVVGPCSIHDPDAAVDYASRLATLRESLSDRLEIVMRVYFEKPRTTIGWKGLINDPDLDGSFNIDKGLRLARNVLSAVNNLGLPAATEFLDMATPQYIADLVAWGAIGARTTESQIHRELASGLSCPVGFKNGTDGNLRIAAEAVKSAAQPHHFMAVTKGGRSAIATTTGNEDCHVILRGGIVPNYDATSIAAACAELGRVGVAPRLMIDVSHANSNKKPGNQPTVAADVAGQVAAGDARIIGVMIESNLVAGRQEVMPNKPLVYGQSITDGCIDWATTETVLHGLADAVERRRSARRAMISSRPGAA